MTPCASSSCAAYELRLLQHRGDDVAGVHLGLAGALDVQHGRLQHAAEGPGLLGFLLHAPRELLDRLLQEGVEVAPQARQVGAARRQDPLAVEVVRQHVQQVLERQVVCRRETASR